MMGVAAREVQVVQHDDDGAANAARGPDRAAPWTLHCYRQAEFQSLAEAARLRVETSSAADGRPDATGFTFVLRRQSR